MSLIAWSPSLSVGINEIDDQHKRIIQYVNDLNDFSHAEKNIGFLRTLLRELTLYTQEHFVLEEKYFKLTDYPAAQAHIAEHLSFVEKIKEFTQNLDEGKNDLILPLTKFLSDWIITHILETDMAYAEFFKEKGLR